MKKARGQCPGAGFQCFDDVPLAPALQQPGRRTVTIEGAKIVVRWPRRKFFGILWVDT